MGRKTSVIWTMPKEEIQLLIDGSYSFQEIIRKLNLHASGSVAKMIKDRILQENLSMEKSGSQPRKTMQKQLKKYWKPINLLMQKELEYGAGAEEDQ